MFYHKVYITMTWWNRICSCGLKQAKTTKYDVCHFTLTGHHMSVPSQDYSWWCTLHTIVANMCFEWNDAKSEKYFFLTFAHIQGLYEYFMSLCRQTEQRERQSVRLTWTQTQRHTPDEGSCVWRLQIWFIFNVSYKNDSVNVMVLEIGN